ncbi:MAG: MoxR family ATPase [Lentisphaerales bacterium]|nr:MoxR family ATPase [Lentisphaerales bacterium]
MNSLNESLQEQHNLDAAESLTASSSPTIDDSQVQEAYNKVQNIRREIGKALIGQDEVVTHILAALLAAGHVLVEGVPGLGKTLMVNALGKTFGGIFNRIQFTPDLMPTDVMGHAMYNMKDQEFIIRKGPVFANLLLADEINRAPAKTQAALLEVMQELQVTIEGEPHKVEPPFMVLATQNPLEQEGTYPLPEAQLDRFLLKVDITYPEEALEVQMVEHITTGRSVEGLHIEEVSQIISPENILELQKVTSSLLIDRQVVEYAVRIIRATRDFPGISIGAGPRGAISLIRVAKAAALLAGRSFVTPDDIKSMAIPCLTHRICLTPELEIEGKTKKQVLENLLDKIEAPRS